MIRVRGKIGKLAVQSEPRLTRCLGEFDFEAGGITPNLWRRELNRGPFGLRNGKLWEKMSGEYAASCDERAD
jgi:hypothetical protein